jgi:hypothetical protein
MVNLDRVKKFDLPPTGNMFVIPKLCIEVGLA